MGVHAIFIDIDSEYSFVGAFHFDIAHPGDALQARQDCVFIYCDEFRLIIAQPDHIVVQNFPI